MLTPAARDPITNSCDSRPSTCVILIWAPSPSSPTLKRVNSHNLVHKSSLLPQTTHLPGVQRIPREFNRCATNSTRACDVLYVPIFNLILSPISALSRFAPATATSDLCSSRIVSGGGPRLSRPTTSNLDHVDQVAITTISSTVHRLRVISSHRDGQYNLSDT